MNKIAKAFANGKAFIPFITCGDPDLDTTAKVVRAMAEAGADLIELGIPFSDPTAEGPVIQAANVRALAAGTTTDKIFDMVRKLRKDVAVPMVFMTYANVVFSYGAERFISACADIGIDGLILPDVPFEEKEEFDPICRQYGLNLISLVAPTSKERIARIAQEANGFVYVVSSLGVTGVRNEITTDISGMMRLIRQNTTLPCAVGFGISTPEQAQKMAALSDGVIVGSAIVKIIAQYGRDAVPHVAKYVKTIKQAIKNESLKEERVMYKEILTKITSGQKLMETEIFDLIAAINRGEITDVQIAGFQVGLLMKGTSLEELSAFAKAMRANCVPLKPQVSDELMDTCGTGGGLSTFNISTATALVAAAAGIPIAKHGSRSISSLSGSADVLEALGVNINLTSAQAEKLIENIGIAFIYAPLFHPVMCKVLPPEAELGIKTIFYTIIGPLINPAFAPRHLLGVYKPELLDTVTYVAKELGYTKAMFVHGLDGLDEISLLGTTRINELRDGQVRTYEICPEDFGMKRCILDDIKTGTPQENAAVIKGVFNGSITGPRKDAIILNSAGALMVGGKADSFEEGIRLARELIESGQAQRKLEDLVYHSNAIVNGNV